MNLNMFWSGLLFLYRDGNRLALVVENEGSLFCVDQRLLAHLYTSVRLILKRNSTDYMMVFSGVESLLSCEYTGKTQELAFLAA